MKKTYTIYRKVKRGQESHFIEVKGIEPFDRLVIAEAMIEAMLNRDKDSGPFTIIPEYN